MSVTDDLLQYVTGRTCIDPETGCWNWTNKVSVLNRPVFSFHGKTAIVYRELWIFIHGQRLESAQFVCHKCDNPLCCNPDHLFLGDATANNADAVNKGRNFAAKDRARNLECLEKGRKVRELRPEVYPRGERHWMRCKPELIRRGKDHWSAKSPEKIRRGCQRKNAMFTPEQIYAIRADKRTLKEIAAEYGCHFTTVGYIRNGKHYPSENI